MIGPAFRDLLRTIAKFGVDYEFIEAAWRRNNNLGNKTASVKHTWYDKETDMTKPHKHKDLIIAWLNGKTIQFWDEKWCIWLDILEPNFNS